LDSSALAFCGQPILSRGAGHVTAISSDPGRRVFLGLDVRLGIKCFVNGARPCYGTLSGAKALDPDMQ